MEPVAERLPPKPQNNKTTASISWLAVISGLAWSSAAIFVITGLVGVFVAFDKAGALNRFALLMAGLFAAGAVAWLNGATRGEGAAGFTSAGAGWLAAALGGYFLLASDWSIGGAVKFAFIQRLGLTIQQTQPDLGLGIDGAINSNVAASALLPLMGLGLGGAVWLWPRRRSLAWLTGAAFVLAAIPLALTASRGAWLGLGVGLLAAGYLWWRTGAGRANPLRYAGDAALALLLLGLAGSFVIALVRPGFAGPLGSLPAGGSALSRASLWRDTLPLIQDYRFTGSGLTGTAEIYSAYVFLLHVNFLTHAHNLYLQIALAQGIPGLIGFAGMALAAAGGLLLAFIHGNRDQRVLAAGALVALTGLLTHGLVDAALYASRAAIFLFPAFGVAWALTASLKRVARRHERRHAGDADRNRGRVWPTLAGALPPLAAILLLFLLPGSRAAFLANLGAVSQTNAELSVYRWPVWPLQDELRLTQAVDLEPAIRLYSAALYAKPDNVTAHRRIGQIALSVGNLDLAREHLEHAHALAPGQRPTGEMLGEVYAVQGDTEAAAQLWRSMDTSGGQLDARRWWWAQVGTEEQQARLAAAISAAEE